MTDRNSVENNVKSQVIYPYINTLLFQKGNTQTDLSLNCSQYVTRHISGHDAHARTGMHKYAEIRIDYALITVYVIGLLPVANQY